MLFLLTAALAESVCDGIDDDDDGLIDDGASCPGPVGQRQNGDSWMVCTNATNLGPGGAMRLRAHAGGQSTERILEGLERSARGPGPQNMPMPGLGRAIHRTNRFDCSTNGRLRRVEHANAINDC